MKQYISSLTEQDPYERLGKQHLEKCGQPLSYSQLIALVEEGGSPSLDLLQTARFREREQQIRSAFQNRISGLLDEQGFLSENSDIEFDRIMRYVDIPAHRHTFVEFTYVLQGRCYQTVNGTIYAQEAGVLTCIASGTEHQTTADPDCVALSIKIRLSAFQQLDIPSLPMFATSLYFECGEDAFVRDTILSMYAQQRQRLPYHELITEKLLEALLIYCCQTHREEMYRFFPGVSLKGKMLEILSYMHENFQTVTLHSVARHFHYSDAYLSNQFHRNTGMTFSELLRTFRLDQARNLLLTTQLKLDEICDRVGYSSTSRFIRDFKEMYSATPHRFRRAANK